jgi:hypothetical protein
MKTEDYDKLKQLCDDNGFELLTESPKENDKFYVVKKKHERVKVEFVNDSWDDFGDYIEVGFVFKIPKGIDNINDYGDKLAQQLEQYLNKQL